MRKKKFLFYICRNKSFRVLFKDAYIYGKAIICNCSIESTENSPVFHGFAKEVRKVGDTIYIN